MQTTAPWNVDRKAYNLNGLRNETKEATLLALAGWEEVLREERATKRQAALAEARALANPPVAGTLVYINAKTSVAVYQIHYLGSTKIAYKNKNQKS